jgi:DNA-binding NarL/FixJ family response regulator
VRRGGFIGERLNDERNRDGPDLYAMKERRPFSPASESNAQDRVRILICDDQRLIRVRIREMLEADPSLVVIAEAAGGNEAVRLALRLRPDLILMDLSMPDMDGAEATRQILARFPQVRIVAFSSDSSSESMSRMFAAGVRGYLLKTADPSELLVSLHRVISGNRVISAPQRAYATWARPD